MHISNKHVNELSSVHKVLKQGTDVNTTTWEQDTCGGAEQLVKSGESPYNYKILQNSEKNSKTRVRLQEIATPQDRSEFCYLILSKILYPKIATSLIARIVENNDDRNM